MAKKRGKQPPIRVGVVGVGRGRSFMQAAAATGMELVAICDIWEERLIAEGKALNVLTFVDYDEFLGCDMDAVVLANYFHQHAPFAIKALNAGKHVMSETAACHTWGKAWRWRGQSRKATRSTCSPRTIPTWSLTKR